MVKMSGPKAAQQRLRDAAAEEAGRPSSLRAITSWVSVNSVISGGQFSRNGRPTVPMPRLT